MRHEINIKLGQKPLFLETEVITFSPVSVLDTVSVQERPDMAAHCMAKKHGSKDSN